MTEPQVRGTDNPHAERLHELLRTRYHVPSGLPLLDAALDWERRRTVGAKQLAELDHEWSMANDRVRCAAHYVPVRPCTPEDHREWAEAILAGLNAGESPPTEACVGCGHAHVPGIHFTDDSDGLCRHCFRLPSEHLCAVGDASESGQPPERCINCGAATDATPPNMCEKCEADNTADAVRATRRSASDER